MGLYLRVRFSSRSKLINPTRLLPIAPGFLFCMKLGFTFYPQDWWSSDTFFDFDPFERYVYLECIFIMYRNGGYMKTQKTQFENRARILVSDIVWEKVTAKFIRTDEGFTSLTVNKRLNKAEISRENGKLGGRPRKEKTQKTQNENLKRKRKRKEYGKGEKSITIKPVYVTDDIKVIYDLKDYFTETNQITSLSDAGWVHFREFIDANPGKIFNDEDHLYNTFRNFCIGFRSSPVEPKKYEDETINRELWTLEAWEKQYGWKLRTDKDFREYFGYEELPSSTSVGINNKR